jgi:hypothetical protein
MDDDRRRLRFLGIELLEGGPADFSEKPASLPTGFPRGELIQLEDPHAIPVPMREVVQCGIPEGDAIRAASKTQDQFSELPGDGLPFLFRCRLPNGYFSLGMGRRDPFQDGALV